MNETNMSLDSAARAVVAALRSALGKAGHVTVAGLSEAVDAPARALARRAADNAVRSPQGVPDEGSLARALAKDRRRRGGGTAAGAKAAARVARRLRSLSFLGRRSTLWVVGAAGPALYESVTRGADEVGLVASHLVHRARAAGMEPDPERIRRAAVQVLSGEPVDTGREPSYTTLALGWLKKAASAVLPLGSHLGARRDPAAVASAAGAVAPAVLARSLEVP